MKANHLLDGEYVEPYAGGGPHQELIVGCGGKIHILRVSPDETARVGGLRAQATSEAGAPIRMGPDTDRMLVVHPHFQWRIIRGSQEPVGSTR